MINILLVEDNHALSEEIAEWLRYEGYKVFQAENGHKGMDMAINEPTDLVLCDILMPVMDGCKMLYELRALEKQAFLPFIFISALSERAYIRQGMALGADDFLTKPVRREELLLAINTVLNRQKRLSQSNESILNPLLNNTMVSLPREIVHFLYSIIGFGRLLSEMTDKFSYNEIAEMGKSILNNGMSLHRLTENYILYLQLEFDHKINVSQHLKSELLEPAIFEESFSIARKYNRESELVIIIEPADVMINENMLRHTISELVDNAFGFSCVGSKVEIRGYATDSYYEITIKDNGCGMYSEDIERIGAFMQFGIEDYSKRGCGMGLAVSREILSRFDGKFSIKSMKNEWTIVKCEFRLQNQSNEIDSLAQ